MGNITLSLRCTEKFQVTMEHMGYPVFTVKICILGNGFLAGKSAAGDGVQLGRGGVFGKQPVNGSQGPQSWQPTTTMKAAGALWRNRCALQKPSWNGEHFVPLT